MRRSPFVLMILVLIENRYCAIVTKCCSQRQNSQPCISYDSSMMAETLDEAMFTFPNLASPDQATLFKPGNDVSEGEGRESVLGASTYGGGGAENADRVGGGNEDAPMLSSSNVGPSVMTTKVSIAAFGAGTPLETAQNGECPTYACMSCKMSLLNGFLANPNIGAADNVTLTAQRNALALKLGTTQGSCDQTTRKRRFTDEKFSRTESHKLKKRLSKRFVLMNTTPDPINDETDDNDINSNFSQETNSENNSGASKNRPVLGVVTNLGCQYRRGEALENNSEWCGLCNLCWQWRKLPSDYYPNYLNEVNCDHNDDGCLSGFGECKPITRAINVMRKKDGEWVKESVETTTACECQVEIGSSLHGLVVK